MNDQVALVQEALARAQRAGTAGTPIDIAVARQYGDSTVTMRAQVRQLQAHTQVYHTYDTVWSPS